MIISVITGFNPYQNNHKYDLKDKAKASFMQHDTFQFQKKFNPVFGSIILQEDIFKCCDSFLKKIKPEKDLDTLKKAASDFFLVELKDSIRKNSEEALQKNEFIHLGFIDDVVNRYSPIKAHVCDFPQTDVNAMKKQLVDGVKTIKFCTNKWMKFEEWTSDPLNNVPVGDVILLTKQMQKSMGCKNIISIDGEELIKDKIALDPVLLYNLFSQTLADIMKFTKDINIKVKIEKIYENHRKDYYAFFMSPKMKSVTEEEAQKFFPTVITILKENGCAIDNLIQKSQENVSLRVPLIGLNEPRGCNDGFFSSGQKFRP